MLIDMAEVSIHWGAPLYVSIFIYIICIILVQAAAVKRLHKSVGSQLRRTQQAVRLMVVCVHLTHLYCRYSDSHNI